MLSSPTSEAIQKEKHWKLIFTDNLLYSGTSEMSFATEFRFKNCLLYGKELMKNSPDVFHGKITAYGFRKI